MQTRIPCVVMRGGTSRGPFFLSSDLPSDPTVRDAVLLAAMGSPHDYQVDGIGGARSLTSKVAMISRSRHAGADVDYLFAQVLIDQPLVDTKPNCGNMLIAVGPFAIEAGLVPAKDPETIVRIFNVNTKTLVEAIVQTPGGKVTYEGDAAKAARRHRRHRSELRRRGDADRFRACRADGEDRLRNRGGARRRQRLHGPSRKPEAQSRCVDGHG
jgi:2-methylaconitate cis-trans-isomerase PrpF